MSSSIGLKALRAELLGGVCWRAIAVHQVWQVAYAARASS